MTIPSAIFQLLPDIRNDIKWRSNAQAGPKNCYVKIKRLSGKEMGSHTRKNIWFHHEKENLSNEDSTNETKNEKHELEKEKNDELGKEKNDELGKEKNDELGKEKNDELEKEKNDELGKEKNDELEKEKNVTNGVHSDSDRDSSKRKRLEALNLLKKSLMISRNTPFSNSSSNSDVKQSLSSLILKTEISKSSPVDTPDNNTNTEYVFDPHLGTELEFEDVPIKENLESDASCDELSGIDNSISSNFNVTSIEQKDINGDRREENLSKSSLQAVSFDNRHSPCTNSDISQKLSSFDDHISVPNEESTAIESNFSEFEFETIETNSNEFEFEELPDIDLPYQSNDTIDMNLNELISEEIVLERKSSCDALIEKSPSQNSEETAFIKQCESNLEEEKQSDMFGDDSVRTLDNKFSETAESSSKKSQVVSNVKKDGKFKLSYLHDNISEVPNNEIISLIKLRYGTKLKDNDSSIKPDVTSALEREYDNNQEIADLQVALNEIYKKSLDKIRLLEHQANSESLACKSESSTSALSNPSPKCSKQVYETSEENATKILHSKLINEAIESVIVSNSVKELSKQPSKSHLHPPTDNELQPKKIVDNTNCNYESKSRRSISNSSKERNSKDRVKRFKRKLSHSSDKQKSSKEHISYKKRRSSDSSNNGYNKSSSSRRSSHEYDNRKRTSHKKRSSCSSDSRASSRTDTDRHRTKSSSCLIERTKMKSSCKDKLKISINNSDSEYHSDSQFNPKKFSRIISHEKHKKISKELTEKTKASHKVDKTRNSLKNVRDSTSRKKIQDNSLNGKKENNCLPDITKTKKSIGNDDNDKQVVSKESESGVRPYSYTEEDSCDGDTDVFEEDEETVCAPGTKSDDCKKSLEINSVEKDLKMKLSAPIKESSIASEVVDSNSENNMLDSEECTNHSVTSSNSSVLYKKDSLIKHKSITQLSSETENIDFPVLDKKYCELKRLLTSTISKKEPIITPKIIPNNGDSICDDSSITVRSLKEKDDNSTEFQTVIDGTSYKRKNVKIHQKNKLSDQGAISKNMNIPNSIETLKKAVGDYDENVTENILNCEQSSHSKHGEQSIDAADIANQVSNKNTGNCSASDLNKLPRKNFNPVNQNSNIELDKILVNAKVLDSLNCTEKYKKNMKAVSRSKTGIIQNGSSTANKKKSQNVIASCSMPNSNTMFDGKEGRKNLGDVLKQLVPSKSNISVTTCETIGGSGFPTTSTTTEYRTIHSNASQNTAPSYSVNSKNDFPNTTWINHIQPNENHSALPITENTQGNNSHPDRISNVQPSNTSHPKRNHSISNSINKNKNNSILNPDLIVVSSNKTVNVSNSHSTSKSKVDSKLVNVSSNPKPTNSSSLYQSVSAVFPSYPQKQGKCEKNSASLITPPVRIKERITNRSDSTTDLRKMPVRLPLLPVPRPLMEIPSQYGYPNYRFPNNGHFGYPGINLGSGSHMNFNQNYIQHYNQMCVNPSNDLNRFRHPPIIQRNMSPSTQFPSGSQQLFEKFPLTNQPIRMIRPENFLVGSNLQNNMNHRYNQSAHQNQMISQREYSNNVQNHFQSFNNHIRQPVANNLSNIQSSNNLHNSSNSSNFDINRLEQMTHSLSGLPTYQRDIYQTNAHPNNQNHKSTLTHNASHPSIANQHSSLNPSRSNPGSSSVDKMRNNGTTQQSEESYVQNNVYNQYANTTVKISYPTVQEKCSKERSNSSAIRHHNLLTPSSNNIVEHTAPLQPMKRAIAVKRMPSLSQCESSNKKQKNSPASVGTKALKVSLEHKEHPSSDIRRVIENLIPNTEMNVAATVPATSSSPVVPVSSSDSGPSPVLSSAIASASPSAKIITVDLEEEAAGNKRKHASLNEDKCTQCRADLQAHMYPCCPTAIYCEKECQVKHWPNHYNECTNGTVKRN